MSDCSQILSGINYRGMKKISCLTLSLFLLLLNFSKVNASEVYDEALTTYDSSLNIYRNDYEDYLLKREQFEKIDSFANQEDLVLAARNMLLSRSQVWLAYWRALRILLIETPGVEKEYTQELVTMMDRHEDELKDHTERLETLKTKEELNGEAIWLNDLKDDYESDAYKVLLHIRMARYHWALTQMEAFVPILEENIEIQIRNESTKKAKLRGLDEVSSIIETSRTEMIPVVEKYIKLERMDYEKAYENMVKELGKSYANTFRSIKLIVEISEGTEL